MIYHFQGAKPILKSREGTWPACLPLEYINRLTSPSPLDHLFPHTPHLGTWASGQNRIKEYLNRQPPRFTTSPLFACLCWLLSLQPSATLSGQNGMCSLLYSIIFVHRAKRYHYDARELKKSYPQRALTEGCEQQLRKWQKCQQLRSWYEQYRNQERPRYINQGYLALGKGIAGPPGRPWCRPRSW